MATYKKERPKCRKIIEQIMQEYGWSEKELLGFSQNYLYPYWDYVLDHEQNIENPLFFFSDGMKIQLRKMVNENKDKKV